MIRNELIKARGDLTQSEIAQIICVSQKYISKLELGQRIPSAQIMAKLSNLYGVKPEELFPDIFSDKIHQNRVLSNEQSITKTG